MRKNALLACLLSTTPLTPVFASEQPQGQQAETTASVDGSTSGTTTEPASATNEIIVTAQRRAQNLQDVPISISAFTAETLEARGAEAITEAITFAPNVAATAGPNGGDDGGFFIRGVGQLDNSIAVDPGVGVYIDEVYIARLQASSFDILDIDRIEVLRGPQGTLFGRNTIGGAVSVVSAQPRFDEISGRARVIIGSRDRIDTAASINLPLSDEAAVRVAGFTRDQRGIGRNVYTGRTFGDVDDIGGRVRFRARPFETFDFTLSADYSRSRGSPSHQILLGFNPLAGITVPVPPPGRPFFLPGVSPTGVRLPRDLGNDRSPNRFLNFFSTPPINNVENWGFSGIASLDLSDYIRLRSITGWRAYDEDTFNDFDATGYVMYDVASDLRQRQFSQELQLAGDLLDERLNFLLGAYYFNEDIENRIELCTGTDAPRQVNRCLRSINDVTLDINSVALFGQVDFDITDRLNVFAGLRWTRETKEQSFESQLNNLDRVVTALPPIAIPAPGTIRQALPVTTVEDTFTATTPRIGFDFEFVDNIHFYSSYSEGFKSGGFTGRPSNAAVQPFDPERVKSYEAGLKTLLFDRALRLNAAVFHSDYEEIQLLVFTPISGLFETRNAGDATIRGFEIEADARIGNQLRFGATLGHLDAEYTRLSPQVAGIRLDTPLPLTPRWTYSLSGEFRQPLGDDVGELRLRADYNYRGRVSYQLEADPLEVQEGFGLLNLRATYAFPNNRYQLSLFGTNVTDKFYLTNAQDTLAGNGTAFGGVGRPREWGLELSLRF